jgi:hypothetical protein
VLFKIKLENDSVYEKLAADTADKALNCWLLNHTDYYQKELFLDNFKILNIDVDGILYEVELRLDVRVNKL